MAAVVIYTKNYCPYCTRAKALLQKKGVDFNEVDVSNNDTLLQEMLAKSRGQRTVPQIFIGATHVGGCDDLYELDRAGELDKLLK